MQSQAIQKEDKENRESPIFVEAEKLFEQMKELSQTVAQRAYEFFEARGRRLGDELSDWFRAESELMRRLPVELSETAEQIIVRAEVPGFKAGEIKISIEPEHLIISGETEQKKEEKTEQKGWSEFRSARFCRQLELPVAVDPNKAVATLKDGILELTMTKAAPEKAVSVEVTTA
ncbi:MAG: Hsp20 family protein [Blastocatellia bacterium]